MRDKHKPQDGPQSKKFVEAARALECDESEERFDAALKKIAAHKPHKDSEDGALKSKVNRSKDPLDAFWARAKAAADKDGYETFRPSFPIDLSD